jgi:glycosyltransferase involved in cell wall biosynthesis
MPIRDVSRHILFLCHLPPARGGSMHAMAQLVKGIADAGHRVTAVSPVDDATIDVSCDHRPLAPVRIVRFVMPKAGGTFLGYRDEILALDMRFEDYYELQARRALPLMRQVVDDDPPDLIVLGHEAMLWGVVDTVRTWGIPTALVSHGPLSAIANGQMSEHLVEPLLDHARRVDIVLTVAEYSARFLAGLGMNARIVRNVVETDRFRPQTDTERLRGSIGLGERDMIVAHASNLRSVKRPMDIVEAAAIALKQEPRLTYLILGDGPLRENMEQRCRVLGLADRFVFTGWVAHGQVDRYIRGADVFIVSSASEGMPYGALEPLSSGRPVVASDLAWTAEILAHGQCMLRFPVGDVECLAERTLEAAADGPLRARMGKAGRAFVERHHRKDRVVEAFMAAVTPLMTPQAPGSGGCSRSGDRPQAAARLAR